MPPPHGITLKTEFLLIYKSSVRTSQEPHYFTAIETNGLQSLFIVRTIRNTLMHSVGGMKTFGDLNEVVLIINTGFKR
jgi:hypothetical protein